MYEAAPLLPHRIAITAHTPARRAAIRCTIGDTKREPVTSFIGREKQVAEVEHRLSVARWVTLTEPDGSGKTRLSLQVAAHKIPDFPDGAWLIELAPVDE